MSYLKMLLLAYRYRAIPYGIISYMIPESYIEIEIIFVEYIEIIFVLFDIRLQYSNYVTPACGALLARGGLAVAIR